MQQSVSGLVLGSVRIVILRDAQKTTGIESRDQLHSVPVKGLHENKFDNDSSQGSEAPLT